jgi:hypothetical protein
VIQFKHDVRRLMARDIADALRPPIAIPPSVWAANNLVVPDGPCKAGAPRCLCLGFFTSLPGNLAI